MATKSRAPNWTNEEINALVNGYRQRVDIINAKFSSTVTSVTKHAAYEALTNEVNAVSSIGGRTVDQIKKQLADIKSKCRKKAAAIRRHREATNGGSPCKTTLSSTEEIMLTTLNPQTINGIIHDGDSEAATSHPKAYIMPLEIISISPHDESISESFVTDEENQTYAPKKRKISGVSALTSDCRITSVHAESILEVERQKLEVARDLLALKRIKLRAYLKEMTASGVDVSEEEKALNFNLE